MPRDLDNIFKYHKLTQDTATLYPMIRDKAKEFASLIEDICPDSREKSIAHTKLEEVMFWANAAIARNRGLERTSDHAEKDK